MKLGKILAFITIIFCFFSTLSHAAVSEWHETSNKAGKVRALASFYNDQKNQKKLIIGLEFDLKKDWKIYGEKSEGVGLPPQLDFSQSKNYVKHSISWPQAQEASEKIGKHIFKYSYYKDKIILPIEIDLKNAGSETTIDLKLHYGMCKDVCIPVTENFSLKIPQEEDLNALAAIQEFYPQQILKEPTSTNQKAPNLEKPEPQKMNYSIALISAVLLALLGGAILNIMPCVLPVLSIKLISIINHSNTPIKQIRFAFFATILGILSCFVFFALSATLIKITGNAFGWGLQFQDPNFLIILILILTFFIGNLSGVFEISFNQVLATVLNRKISDLSEQKNIFMTNFLSGILAVLLATPCSAPFLGSAISFALTQKLHTIFIIFFAIGLGFASPYIAFLITPKLVYLLPKPGAWMNKIKQLMAIFLAATVLWLLYILSDNLGKGSALLIATLSLLLLLSVKIKYLFLKFLTISTVLITIFSIPTEVKNKPIKRISNDQMFWQEFDEKLLESFIAEGQTVIVDITADWCITCKFNKINVLEDEEVVEKLKQANIITMRGDITKPNQVIMDFLHKNGRFAIPFNAVYGPNAKDGLLTSELLNKKELLKLIDQAK